MAATVVRGCSETASTSGTFAEKDMAGAHQCGVGDSQKFIGLKVGRTNHGKNVPP